MRSQNEKPRKACTDINLDKFDYVTLNMYPINHLTKHHFDSRFIVKVKVKTNNIIKCPPICQTELGIYLLLMFKWPNFLYFKYFAFN